MNTPSKRFYTVSDAAKILGVSHSTLTIGIDTGVFPAIKVTGDHRSTRIAHETLFPSSGDEVRFARIKRLVLAQKRAQEIADRLCREWGEAQLRASEAAQALYDELGLQEVDAALERLAG